MTKSEKKAISYNELTGTKYTKTAPTYKELKHISDDILDACTMTHKADNDGVVRV